LKLEQTETLTHPKANSAVQLHLRDGARS